MHFATQKSFWLVSSSEKKAKKELWLNFKLLESPVYLVMNSFSQSKASYTWVNLSFCSKYSDMPVLDFHNGFDLSFMKR